MDKETALLKHELEESRNTVAITGAGISFSSGGLNFDHTDSAGMRNLMALGSEDVLKSEPERYYQLLDQAFLHSMFSQGPSLAHRALAQLESDGKLSGIITTNVDCLHTMAGSKNVAEIQGSLQVNRCTSCGRHYDNFDIWAHGSVPVCPECGGKIWTFPFYSHVGLYKEGVKYARKLIAKAELILIIGANGSYGDAYWGARSRKAQMIQINPASTIFTPSAKLNIRRDADSVFQELMEEDSPTTASQK